MKLSVLASSAQFLASAGSRIRYQRLRPALARLGCSIDVATIDSLGAEEPLSPSVTYLFSKIQDARGLALARELRAKGARVGVDLFDDYFSQLSDARFAPQRLWLEQMAHNSDFFLCSTPRMQHVAKTYFGDTPGHVLNDPFSTFEPDRLAAVIENKRRRALETRVIRVVWFGMGDNPNFPVGLHDLVSYGRLLKSFVTTGFEVDLKVLTNLRALDGGGLAMLRRLPFRPAVEEWTEAREVACLEDSLVAFLPVNAQGFSIAKSLNRAVTALTGGTQVLCAGYPLYAPLHDFLYHRPEALIKDLNEGNLRVSRSHFSALREQLDKLSNPDVEAAALCTFLETVNSPIGTNIAGITKPPEQPRLAIIHGERTTGAIHKFAQRRDWLSLASPVTPTGIACDAHLSVFTSAGRVSIRLNARATDWLRPEARTCVHPIEDVRGGFVLELFPDDLGISIDPALAHLAQMPREGMTGTRMALQPRVSYHVRAIYSELFGPLDFIDSELNPLLCEARELEKQANRACP
ncbi:hypothetical protein [Novosphingobium mathurense]|uniref:Uncharacterized protein n=1 Tax=Novosphingobium mathurense TaxID=428990 RepID=A0A1U6ITM1_9SPHN|nr:hypothetical protein [Novosphingobium mathurense]SLK11349.1 hypothetical protein SAMN06295987_11427 [Novosphingobium mathurense]